MLVTITCDASYDQFSNKSGYAFLISSNAGRFSKSDKLDAKNIVEAELMAIANSLYYVLHHKKLWGVSKIILNVDFITAEQMIRKEGGTPAMRKSSGETYRIIVGVIKELMEDLEENGYLNIEFRHVKSHSRVKDTRSKANKYVDKLAVKARKNGG